MGIWGRGCDLYSVAAGLLGCDSPSVRLPGTETHPLEYTHCSEISKEVQGPLSHNILKKENLLLRTYNLTDVGLLYLDMSKVLNVYFMLLALHCSRPGCEA